MAFDEVADMQKMPKEVVTTLKTFCESGTFARGKEQLSGTASIAMFGNTNQPVDVMVRSSHLFAPMPEVIREDTAFLDRIHFYIPGWEIPKMQMAMFTNGYGFVVDYLAEALREMRRRNLTEVLDHDFSLGAQLKSRDVKAVRKTVAGLVKLIHPHGELSKDDLRELLELAMEGRRRVKGFGGRSGQGGPMPARSGLRFGNGQTEAGRRHRRFDEGVHPAGIRLSTFQQGTPKHRTGF